MSEPLEYESNVVPRRRLAPLVAKLAIAVAVFALLIAILLPSLNRRRDEPAVLTCASNLKQIGQAMLLYANENRDQMPPDFVALLETEDLVPEVFVCWGSGDEKTTATQPTAIRADFAAGGHCSYVYVAGLGRYSQIGADDVVAFEPPGHHDGSSAILFGDGHAERVDDAAAKDIVRQYDNAVRPIRLPAK